MSERLDKLIGDYDDTGLTFAEEEELIEALRAEVSRLRAAIERHREQRYGDQIHTDTPTCLPHRDDAELYKALEGEW